MLSEEKTAPAGWSSGTWHGIAEGQLRYGLGGLWQRAEQPPLGAKTLEIVVALLSGFS